MKQRVTCIILRAFLGWIYPVGRRSTTRSRQSGVRFAGERYARQSASASAAHCCQKGRLQGSRPLAAGEYRSDPAAIIAHFPPFSSAALLSTPVVT